MYNGSKDMDGFEPNFNEKLKKQLTTVDYQLTFNTTPGNAKYEVKFYIIFYLFFFIYFR